jgi:hypothetical protein
MLVNYNTPRKTPWPPAEAMNANVVVIIITDYVDVKIPLA